MSIRRTRHARDVLSQPILGAITTGTQEGSPNDLAGLHRARRDTEHLNSENASNDVPIFRCCGRNHSVMF